MTIYCIYIKKVKLILILIFAISLFAQYEWSDPLQLSETGNFPSINYTYPAITVDNNGVIHAFWAKVIESAPWEWYYQIEYRSSTDGGLTWSETENLTPEYTDLRIYDIKAVCDSQNNIHLVYSRGFENCKEMYKKYDGSSWSEPYEIYGSFTTNLRIGIDNSDRLFVTWYLGYTTYFTYCDTAEVPPVWNAVKAISSDHYVVNGQFVYDSYENLYSVGHSQTPTYPYFYKFNKKYDGWSFEKMYDIDAVGCALALSDNNNNFYSNILIGPTNSDNLNYESEKFMNDTIWSDLEFVNEDNDKYRQMFIDKNDNLHLFEVHFGSNTSIIYSTNPGGIWNTEIIQEETGFSFGNIDVAFNNKDSLYIVYTRGNTTTHSGEVYFQTKPIDTGIEDSDELLVMSYELEQNYPNPFNSQTSINYTVKEISNIEISIYNSKGEFVQELVNKKQSKGKHNITFDASKLNSGIYYYRLKIDGMVKVTRKMLYLR
ncbi:MAG: T9SS type A sorting domain-containing protein [Candidatus Delongbacteria bacterium]|jgi:hypothetical protein|nr:T9SS type A sorting domain-containing protein [Candidatus Delongbacteria bacterium]